MLVVTRLGPGGVCHVGYVDAKANPDANELARKIADEHARTFKCGKDKRIVLGKPSECQHAARQRLVLPAERDLIEALRPEALG